MPHKSVYLDKNKKIIKGTKAWEMECSFCHTKEIVESEEYPIKWRTYNTEHDVCFKCQQTINQVIEEANSNF